MQRTKHKIELKEEEEKSSHLLSQESIKQFTTGSTSKLDQIVTVDSYVPCEGLLFGRMSFKGCNPEIERLMVEQNGGKKEEDETETEVTAIEMASRYSNMAVGDVERNPQVKRKRNKYIRPVDD